LAWALLLEEIHMTVVECIKGADDSQPTISHSWRKDGFGPTELSDHAADILTRGGVEQVMSLPVATANLNRTVDRREDGPDHAGDSSRVNGVILDGIDGRLDGPAALMAENDDEAHVK